MARGRRGPNRYGAPEAPRAVGGARVREVRVDVLGWTQTELAEVVGISQAYLSKIENDTVRPRLDVQRRLAAVLRERPGRLWFGDDTPPPGARVRALPRSAGASGPTTVGGTFTTPSRVRTA